MNRQLLHYGDNNRFRFFFKQHEMQPSKLKAVKKSWTEHNKLVQKRYRRKGTLRQMLRRYFNDCRCNGVYLLIDEDNHYFTVNFN